MCVCVQFVTSIITCFKMAALDYKLDITSAAFDIPDFDEFLKACRCDPDDQWNVFHKTMEQYKSPAWIRARIYRVTASTCVDIYKAMSFPKRTQDKLASVYMKHLAAFNRSTCAPGESAPPASCAAMMYGLNNEEQGREAYLSQNTHLTYRPCGMFINQEGSIAASPDGLLFRDPQCADNESEWRQAELLEIKCPYRARAIEGANPDETKRLVIEAVPYLKYGKGHGKNRKVKIDRTCPQGLTYWHQIMCAMNVTGIHRCHFVVWTPYTCISVGYQYDPAWDHVASELASFWGVLVKVLHTEKQTQAVKQAAIAQSRKCPRHSPYTRK